MNYLDTQIQYYENDIRKTKPIGVCTLGQLLASIRNPKQEVLERFKEIAKASSDGDKKLKDELKSKLWYFTPCIYSKGNNRTYEDIDHWTAVMVLDFDNLEQELAVELRDWLFENYSCVVASMLSSSRKGVKCFVRIPEVISVEEFKLYFYGIASEMQYIVGFDHTTQNSALAFYLTYDYDIKVREDATEWTQTGYKLDEFKQWEGGEIIPIDDVTEQDREEIIKQLTCMYANITDNGHIPNRSAGLLMGGYIGSGYFTYDEAVDILDELIDNTSYLQAKPRTYKTTTRQMLKIGSKSPLYLTRHEHLYEA
jgi:VirE N-terminal domain.